ncbi:MAG: hypothetical protein KDK37_19115 [Leptospiraceae bacterium]|nr:hypothetical protein [Leptospiraceae bacterium]
MLYAIAAAFWISFYPYYPETHYALFTTAVLIFFLFTLKQPMAAFGLLLLVASFYGNHPGGRFLETFDILLILSVAGFTIRKRTPDLYSSPDGSSANASHLLNHLMLVILLVMALGFCSAYYLFESLEGYKLEPFYWMAASEWLPHYSIRVAIVSLLAFVAAREFAARIREVPVNISATVMFLIPAIPLLIGIMESLIPGLGKLLDRLHIYLDGYVHRSPSHLSAIKIAPALDGLSPNSLFWNRSWFSVYLIACLPLVGLGVHLLGPQRRRRTIWRAAIVTLLAAYSYCVIAIGARAGLATFGCFAMVLLLLRIPMMRRPSVLWLIGLVFNVSTIAMNFYAF